MLPAPSFGSVTATWTLARWLGPWARDTDSPRGIHRRTVVVPAHRDDDRPFDAWIYAPPARLLGAYLVVPGLHYAGPADPRLDRLCRVLAASGFLVLAPFLPDFLALHLEPRLLRDVERAFETLCQLPELPRRSGGRPRPGVFSISFGSLPALRLAAGEHRDRVGGLVVFGGYGDFEATLTFALTGEVDQRVVANHDPLNRPVVFINLLDDMPVDVGDRAALREAWRRYVQSTWGREVLRRGNAFREIAYSQAQALPESLRRWFLMGCGAEPGGLELCRQALAKGRTSKRFLDPRPHLAGVRCPVSLVHGVDDDVIPHGQLDAIDAALPAHVQRRLYRTGIYAHTRSSGLATSVRQLPVVARELATMAGILAAVVRTGSNW